MDFFRLLCIDIDAGGVDLWVLLSMYLFLFCIYGVFCFWSFCDSFLVCFVVAVLWILV